MTRMRWDKVRRSRDNGYDAHKALERAGTRLIARADARRSKDTPGKKAPVKLSVMLDRNQPREVWRVIGADCPWNTTPGRRQVWHNGQQLP